MDIINDDIMDEIIIEASIVLHNLITKPIKKPALSRVNPYLKERKRKGRFSSDFSDMIAETKIFHENFHMSVEDFENLFQLVEPYLLPKKHTRPDDEITTKEKLAVVIEYFASGSLQRHIASIYRISKQHLGKIIDDVCDAIYLALKCTLPALNETSYIATSNEFNSKWNFPNCIGAIDGKHVAIKAPNNSGSLFYNYKGHYSIVLMGVADACYKFIYLDVGAYGSEGDANVFRATKFGQGVLQDNLPFPEDATVNGTKIPYVFVADDAFPLCKRIIKPYAGRKGNKLTDEQRIFNYRLSRARRCVENSFGILCTKWLCLRRTMFCSADRAQKIIMACCFLHNYLLKINKENYCPENYADYFDVDGKLVEGEWRRFLSADTLLSGSMTHFRGRHTSKGKLIREQLNQYFNSTVGSLEWQRQAVFIDS